MEIGSYDQPNILFLRGCFLSDCSSIEDIFDERIINESMIMNNTDKIYEFKDIEYNTIPIIFKSVETWVKTTNLKCWSCDCNFHSVPIFIPTRLDKSITNDKMIGNMETLGNFCSWNCASSYIDTYSTNDIKWEHHEYLKRLYKIMNGKHIDIIANAPVKTLMKKYGGHLTLEEYRELLEHTNDAYSKCIVNNMIENIKK
jgi:hypothetical protein